MKFKIRRATGTVESSQKPRRRGRFAAVPALHGDRPTRVYSLLLPPNGNATRR